MDSFKIQTVQQDNSSPITTVMSEAPQLQTVMQEGMAPITTIVNAPWVNVTSVNGKTGDVTIEVKLGTFEPNHYYEKGTAILQDGYLYYAGANFTSGTTFNANDWLTPNFAQEQADWKTTSTTAKSYIKNKPTNLSQFTNDLNLISEDDVNSIVTGRIEPLEESVENLETDLTAKVNANTTLIGNVSSELAELNTNVDNMKTDGSVTKLGTSTVGSASQPIYLNSGSPIVCSVGTSPSNVASSVTVTNSSGQTYVGSSLHLKYGTSSYRTIQSGANGPTTPDKFVQDSSYICLDERDDWHYIGKSTFSSAAETLTTYTLSSTYRAKANYIYKFVLNVTNNTATTTDTSILLYPTFGSATPATNCYLYGWGKPNSSSAFAERSAVRQYHAGFSLVTTGYASGYAEAIFYGDSLGWSTIGKSMSSNAGAAGIGHFMEWGGTVATTSELYTVQVHQVNASSISGTLEFYVKRKP